MGGGKKILGIDIGGTKIHIGVVQDGMMINAVKLSTSALAPKAQILDEIVAGIEQLMDAEIIGIGIGVPGLVDECNGIVQSVLNIPSWREVHLKEHLESHFKKPVFITNDANSFVAGVKTYGRGKGFKNMVGITLGTGFGTGIIINGNLYTGMLSSAGEFGGIPYLDKTLEDYCSGKFFQREFGLTGKKVMVLAEAGDAAALDILNQYGHHLGVAIKIILFALSPEAIFLGGSVSSSFRFFKDAMYKCIHTFPFQLVMEKLVIEQVSIPNAAILGSAALFQMRRGTSNFSIDNAKVPTTLFQNGI